MAGITSGQTDERTDERTGRKLYTSSAYFVWQGYKNSPPLSLPAARIAGLAQL